VTDGTNGLGAGGQSRARRRPFASGPYSCATRSSAPPRAGPTPHRARAHGADRRLAHDDPRGAAGAGRRARRDDPPQGHDRASISLDRAAELYGAGGSTWPCGSSPRGRPTRTAPRCATRCRRSRRRSRPSPGATMLAAKKQF
jgi:hypothetical protein